MAHTKSAHFPLICSHQGPPNTLILAPSSLWAEWKRVQADLYSIPSVMWQGQAEPTWSGEGTGLGDSRVGDLPPRFTGVWAEPAGGGVHMCVIPSEGTLRTLHF